MREPISVRPGPVTAFQGVGHDAGIGRTARDAHHQIGLLLGQEFKELAKGDPRFDSHVGELLVVVEDPIESGQIHDDAAIPSGYS